MTVNGTYDIEDLTHATLNAKKKKVLLGLGKCKVRMKGNCWDSLGLNLACKNAPWAFGGGLEWEMPGTRWRQNLHLEISSLILHLFHGSLLPSRQKWNSWAWSTGSGVPCPCHHLHLHLSTYPTYLLIQPFQGFHFLSTHLPFSRLYAFAHVVYLPKIPFLPSIPPNWQSPVN